MRKKLTELVKVTQKLTRMRPTSCLMGCLRQLVSFQANVPVEYRKNTSSLSKAFQAFYFVDLKFRSKLGNRLTKKTSDGTAST